MKKLRPAGSRFWYGQVAANFTGKKLIDLGMSGHGGTSVGCRISPPGMIAAFADENASMRVEMPDEFPPFHTRTACSS